MVQIANTIGSTYGDVIRGGRADVTKVHTPDPRQALYAVRTLRRAVHRLGLAWEVRAEAGRSLDEIDVEIRSPDPDRGVITARLERFTELLTDTGALATAGASLVRPIRAIATWLGPIGAAAIGRLI